MSLTRRDILKGAGGVLVGPAAAASVPALVPSGITHAIPPEDGYDLWLRYRPLSPRSRNESYGVAREIVSSESSPTLDIAQSELALGLSGLLGSPMPFATRPTQDGSIILGTPKSSPLIATLQLDLDEVGNDGFTIRSMTFQGHRVTVITANGDVGVLYGAFHFLRLAQTGQPLRGLNISSAPRIRHRILDHWDNLDRTVERGYAGESIWDWQKLPDYLDPRYVDYARACASIGINGVVPTNVNASPENLTPLYLHKYAALANLFRPYGLRIYMATRFDAPIEIGGLKSADPIDTGVQEWWRNKIEVIYSLIPDFGGFLVKANSEGQPGPKDYGRTHADGANMLACALTPHGGVVMWRAFVDSKDDWNDRTMGAYDEFTPLDGKFHDNVLLQVKNGPLDFQPREPFHPLFGAMPRTPVMMEFQITKEYLGFATHLVYLGALFEETLRSDTFARGKGSTVAMVIDGSLFNFSQTGIAGVANIGSDRNWTGSHFDQANWYAFGRLAWDPMVSAREITEEWIRMTFSNDPAFVKSIADMMIASREAVVDYMTPMGLHHQMAESHYGPAPWLTSNPPAPWTPVYFNRADEFGIGFDRTAKGTDAVSQYFSPVSTMFNDINSVPERFLLWFHHLPWGHTMPSGRSFWDELVIHYTRGVQEVAAMRRTWSSFANLVDAERFAQVTVFLAIQEKEARWWRDASIAYFQSLSHRPLPAGCSPPDHDLKYYEELCFPFVPGAGPINRCRAAGKLCS